MDPPNGGIDGRRCYHYRWRALALAGAVRAYPQLVLRVLRRGSRGCNGSWPPTPDGAAPRWESVSERHGGGGCGEGAGRGCGPQAVSYDVWCMKTNEDGRTATMHFRKLRSTESTLQPRRLFGRQAPPDQPRRPPAADSPASNAAGLWCTNAPRCPHPPLAFQLASMSATLSQCRLPAAKSAFSGSSSSRRVCRSRQPLQVKVRAEAGGSGGRAVEKRTD